MRREYFKIFEFFSLFSTLKPKSIIPKQTRRIEIIIEISNITPKKINDMNVATNGNADDDGDDDDSDKDDSDDDYGHSDDDDDKMFLDSEVCGWSLRGGQGAPGTFSASLYVENINLK